MELIDKILSTSIMRLDANLNTITDKDLLGKFRDTFKAMGNYDPMKNESLTEEMKKEQRAHIWDYSTTFIEQFKARVLNSSETQLEEFAKLLQQMMMKDTKEDETYYTRTLQRLYRYTTDLIQFRGMPNKEFKQVYL